MVTEKSAQRTAHVSRRKRREQEEDDRTAGPWKAVEKSAGVHEDVRAHAEEEPVGEKVGVGTRELSSCLARKRVSGTTHTPQTHQTLYTRSTRAAKMRVRYAIKARGSLLLRARQNFVFALTSGSFCWGLGSAIFLWCVVGRVTSEMTWRDKGSLRVTLLSQRSSVACCAGLHTCVWVECPSVRRPSVRDRIRRRYAVEENNKGEQTPAKRETGGRGRKGREDEEHRAEKETRNSERKTRVETPG